MKRICHLLLALLSIMTPFHAFSKVKDGEVSPVEALLNQKDTLQSIPSTQFSAIQKTQTMPESLVGKELSAFESSTYAKQSAPAQAEQMIEPKGLYVTINATVHENQRYTVSIRASRDNSLFIFPMQIDSNDPAKKRMIQSPILQRFFDFDKQKFEFDSQFLIKEPRYQQTINDLSEVESKRILVQQSFLSRARNYYLESIIGSHLKKAKLIAGDALVKLNRALRDVLEENDYKLLDKKQFTFEDINIKDQAYSSDNAKPRMIYNAIREFGQVIGFEMPSIEKPWYVRHKGKIALTAGALALLTYMHYSNVLGTRSPSQIKNSPITSSEEIASGVTERTPAVAQASWFSKSLAAAKTKFSSTLSNFKSAAAKAAVETTQKETSKAVVSRIARSRGIGPQMSSAQSGKENLIDKMDPFGEYAHAVKQPVSVQDLKHEAGDIAGHALTQELAEAYGYELVPKANSNIERPISIPAGAREAVIQKLFKPVEEGGAGVEESFRKWR